MNKKQRKDLKITINY